MFIAIRKYRVRRGSSADWAQRVRDGFVPLIRELTGFRGYYLLEGGRDELIAISLFDSADGKAMITEGQPGISVAINGFDISGVSVRRSADVKREGRRLGAEQRDGIRAPDTGDHGGRRAGRRRPAQRA
jgi:Antibiotic biosynthesis monooxygenase